MCNGFWKKTCGGGNFRARRARGVAIVRAGWYTKADPPAAGRGSAVWRPPLASSEFFLGFVRPTLTVFGGEEPSQTPCMAGGRGPSQTPSCRECALRRALGEGKEPSQKPKFLSHLQDLSPISLATPELIPHGRNQNFGVAKEMGGWRAGGNFGVGRGSTK